MKALHEKLMRNSAYERWHHHPAHQVVHWLALLAVAAVAAFIFIDDARTGFGQGVEVPAPPMVSTVPNSAGKVVGAAPGRLLLKFDPAADEGRRRSVSERYGMKEMSEIRGIGVRVMRVGGESDIAVLAERLNRDEAGAVEYAEPDYLVEPSFEPNDPWYANWQKDKQQIGAPAAWNATSGAGDQVIAIADTGVDCTHEDLAPNCVAGWNFYDGNSDTADVHGHGTRVAGVAAAVGNNGIGVAGVVWSPKIMPLRVSAPDGLASYSAIASAVTYAADHGVRVVNNSYQSGASRTVADAAAYLRGKGGLLVVSEGNDGVNAGYPDATEVVSVSAVDASDVLYSWSNFGADVDVAAPGCTGATTVNHGGYANFCGTSNAAPEASGTLMLIFAATPGLSPDQARDILFRSSKDLGPAGRDTSFGWGRIDAAAAVTMAMQDAGVTPSTIAIVGYGSDVRSATSAVVGWTTDAASTGTVSYGTSAAALSLSAADATLGTTHSLTLTGLRKSTKYYYRIHAVGADGVATADSPIASFRTKAK